MCTHSFILKRVTKKKNNNSRSKNKIVAKEQTNSSKQVVKKINNVNKDKSQANKSKKLILGFVFSYVLLSF